MVDSITSFTKIYKTPEVYLLLSLAVIIFSTNSSSAFDVDLFALNPYWLSFNRLCLSINAFSLLQKSFSSIFENWGRSATGL